MGEDEFQSVLGCRYVVLLEVGGKRFEQADAFLDELWGKGPASMVVFSKANVTIEFPG